MDGEHDSHECCFGCFDDDLVTDSVSPEVKRSEGHHDGRSGVKRRGTEEVELRVRPMVEDHCQAAENGRGALSG